MVMWQTIRSSFFGRHSHDHAYAAIVLSGGYEEAGDHGRFRVAAGDVVLHEGFEAHIDRFSRSGAVVLNLPIPMESSFFPGIAIVADPDSIVRLAERSQAQAARVLLSAITARRLTHLDWPDELAAALIKDPSLCLSRWSRDKGIKPWTVSRGFMQVFALSPSAFRARARARQAWRAVATNEESLAKIAADLRFADQSHMTRSVKQLTGKAPQAWRSSANRFKTQRCSSL
jgi:AraC-like DNA-binding protein